MIIGKNQEDQKHKHRAFNGSLHVLEAAMVRVSVYRYQKLDARKPLGQHITTNQEAAPQTSRQANIHTVQQVPRTVKPQMYRDVSVNPKQSRFPRRV